MKWLVIVTAACSWLCATAIADFQSIVIIKLFEDCVRTDWQSCLKMKILSTLEHLENARAISVAEGITLVNENFSVDEYPAFTEKALKDGLPRNLDDRNEILNSLIFDKMLHWISKYTLRWKLSKLSNAINEGRGKSKKYGHLLLMPLMMAASFIPLALGTLAILAGKALIVGKMALLLTAIIGVRKLFSNSHDEDEHQRAMKRISDYGMKLKSDMMAQKMAFRMHHANELHGNM